MPNNKNRKQRGKNRKGKGKGGSRFDLTAPIATRKQFRREVQAAARLQFQPQRRALRAEQRAERELRNRRIPGYFAEYDQAVQNASTATDAAYDQALATISKTTAASSAQDNAVRAKMDAEARADAARTGTTYRPTTDSAQASASRRATSDQFAALTANQGATEQAYLADKRRIGTGEKVNQLMKSHDRSRTIRSDKRALAREVGAFKVDQRRQIRSDERNYDLQLKTLASDKRGQNTQLAVAKQYGKNKRKEQSRSLQNQLAVIQAQMQAAKAKGNQTLLNQLKVTEAQLRAKLRGGRQSKHIVASQGGGGNDREAGTMGKAMSYLRSHRGGKFESYQAAVDYLVNRGIPLKLAKKAATKFRNLRSSTNAQSALHGTPRP